MTLVVTPNVSVKLTYQNEYNMTYLLNNEKNHNAVIYTGDSYEVIHAVSIKRSKLLAFKIIGKISIKNTAKHSTGDIKLLINIYRSVGPVNVLLGSIEINLDNLVEKASFTQLINTSIILNKDQFCDLKRTSHVHVEFKCLSNFGANKAYRVYPISFPDISSTDFNAQICDDKVFFEKICTTDSCNFTFATQHHETKAIAFSLKILESDQVKAITSAKFDLITVDILPIINKTVNIEDPENKTITYTLSGPDKVADGEIFSISGKIKVDTTSQLLITGGVCFTTKASSSVSVPSVSVPSSSVPSSSVPSSSVPSYEKVIQNIELKIGDEIISFIDKAVTVNCDHEPFNMSASWSNQIQLSGTYQTELIKGANNIQTGTKNIKKTEELSKGMTQQVHLKLGEFIPFVDQGTILTSKYVLEKVNYVTDFDFAEFISEQGTTSAYPIEIFFRRDGIRVSGINTDTEFVGQATLHVDEKIFNSNVNIKVISPQSCFEGVKTYSRADWFGTSGSDEALEHGPSNFTFGTITYDPLTKTKDTQIITDLILHYPTLVTNPTTLSLEVSHGIAFGLNLSINSILAHSKFKNLHGTLSGLNGKTCAEVQAIFEQKVSTGNWGLDLPADTMSLINELVWPMFYNSQNQNQDYLECP